MVNKYPIVVLISGNGSNLQAIIDYFKTSEQVEIKAVISNKVGAYGLQRAHNANIKTAILEHTQFNSREDYDQSLAELIHQYQPQLIVLAGFMRILSAPFIAQFKNQLINIHPALLPQLKGLHTHRRALEAKQTEHGASVHLVTEELDSGHVILQAKVPIKATDNEATLAQRVLKKEHIIYPLVIQWIATGRLILDSPILFDQKPLTKPLQLPEILHEI